MAVHEKRLKLRLSRRKAIAKTIPEFVLPGKPFERVRKAYRDFEKEIGSMSLDDYKFERAFWLDQEASARQEAQTRERLADLESRAADVLGTDDLSGQNILGLRVAWESEEVQKAQNVFEGSEASQVREFKKHYGTTGSDRRDLAKARELRELGQLARKRCYFADDLLALRRKVAWYGEKNPGE